MINRETINNTLGKTFADKLDELIISNGKLEYTRREMVEILHCANFISAVKLNKVLRKLKIGTAAQLSNTDPFSLLRIRGVGESTVFVAMCILDAHEYDVEAWWGWKQDNIVKFSAFKHRAAQRTRRQGKHEVA